MDARLSLDAAQKRRAVVGALGPMALAVLEQTIVAPILPVIAQEFGGVYVAWMVTAYLVASTASTPLWGKIADARGRRGALFAALGLFALGSAICALGADMGQLVGGRAIQGLGGGGLIAVAQTLIADAVAPKERGRYVGYISAVWLTSSVVGPMLGGFAASKEMWRLVFWINLPLALVAAVFARAALSVAPVAVASRRIDVLGAFVAAAAIACFLMSLTWLGSDQDWEAAGALVASLAIGAVFLRRSAAEADPLIPISVLRLSIARQGAATTFLAFAGHVGLATSTPFFLVERGLYPAHAGMSLMALLVGGVAGANTAGRLMSRDPRYRRYGLWGLALAASAAGWLGFRAGAASLAEIEAALFLAGIGAGAQNPVTAVAAQNAVARQDLGVVTALLAVARSLGGAFGAAAFIALVARLAPDVVGPARHAPAFFAASCCYLLAFAFLRGMEEKPLRAD
jgi:MFS family permease